MGIDRFLLVQLMCLSMLAISAYCLHKVTTAPRLSSRKEADKLRRRLKSRLRQRSVPALCSKHASKSLKKGQMSIIDSTRCEECLKITERVHF